ncbi:MAG: site-specific integrase [Acidobacteria bacterium]|nr:site-specific integrase [Acidobacteriota bacterium]
MRGSGRIFKRKSSSVWQIAYCYRGKEIRESAADAIMAAKREAEKKRKPFMEDDAKQAADSLLKKRLREIENDREGLKSFVGPQQDRLTVGDLLDALEADYRLRQVKSLPQILAHLKPIRDYFGDRKAVQVSAELVDRYIEECLKDGKASATINRGTQLLAQAFRLAVEGNRLSRAPKIRHLSEKGNARQGFFERADFEAVVSALPDYLKNFARFGYLSGWRKGEISSLKWADVDMDGRVIRLRPEASKNGEGRTLGLEEELWEIVEQQAAKQAYEIADKTVAFSLYVFHYRGEPIGDIRKAWASACKWANIPGRLFHDLRRTAVRNMIRAGVPERVAMEISGHKTRAIFDRYNIVSENDLREAMRKTQAYLKAAPSERKVVSVAQASGSAGK